MNLKLYDINLNVIAYIGNDFISCLWAEGYNTTELFSLEVYDSSEYRKKIKPDCYVGRTDKKTMMVIKTVQYIDNTIVATGYESSRILEDVAFIGTITENSIIDTSIINAYNNSNKFPHLEFVKSGITEKYAQQISNKSFAELYQTICQTNDIGLKITRNGQNLNAKLYKPKSRNIKLIEQFGNIQTSTIILSTENLKNYAIVLGEGEGDTRTKEIVDASDGEIKRQMIVDARDIQKEEGETEANYKARLRARGVESLLTQQQTWEVACTPLTDELGVKFDLGDIVTVILTDFDLKFHSRIVRTTQKEQLNTIETTLEIGNITIIR